MLLWLQLPAHCQAIPPRIRPALFAAERSLAVPRRAVRVYVLPGRLCLSPIAAAASPSAPATAADATFAAPESGLLPADVDGRR